ncbi:MAG TPA: Ni/Fe-hydrogenase, b-type cytochrome subunit [Holophagaceae bacterium]|nr:Ni/Fe-hydrogenase, b-type cytochrome subunit [Holophagaceae bacterium]
MTSSHLLFKRLYVWELPVRLFHVVNALCLTVLAASGFYISGPVGPALAQEASFQYWFGWVRFIHFAAAYAFLINLLARVYWGFVGNAYARWREYVPTTKACWREVKEVLKVDIFQTQLEGHIRIGHNRVAGTSYLGLFLVSLFQIATGFALYAPMSHSWAGRAFAWVVPLMGSEAIVRQWHHAMTWVFILFTLVHVYLVFYHDFVEGRGTASSMVGGWKFEREDELEHH